MPIANTNNSAIHATSMMDTPNFTCVDHSDGPHILTHPVPDPINRGIQGTLPETPPRLLVLMPVPVNQAC